MSSLYQGTVGLDTMVFVLSGACDWITLDSHIIITGKRIQVTSTEDLLMRIGKNIPS